MTDKTAANKVAIRTENAICDAFLSLIGTNAYANISVTDICRRADIVRKTFYNHFHSKDDVVRFLMNRIFREIEGRIDLASMGVREILSVTFGFVMENRADLVLFYNRDLIRFAHKSISDYITREHIFSRVDLGAMDPRAYPYIAAQISAVLIGMIETWIENDFEEPVDFLAGLAETLMYQPASMDRDGRAAGAPRA